MHACVRVTACVVASVCVLILLQKYIRKSSRKSVGRLKTLLPLNPSSDVWKEALPVTKITDSMYPFDDDGKRPTKVEVRPTLNIYTSILKIKGSRDLNDKKL